MTDTPIIRTSEERDFKRCKQKWDWAWQQGLRPRGEESRDALWFGTGVHLAFQKWYIGPGLKRGAHPAETWNEYAAKYFGGMKMEQMDEQTEERIVTLRELGEVLMVEYIKLYGDDPHKLYIQAEQTFALEIPWPKMDPLELKQRTDSGEVLAKWVGTFDGVYRHADTGKPWLDEHKTAKAISTGHLPLDPQASKYWAVATGTLRAKGLLNAKDTLAGIEYNFIRKALPDDRPKDAEGYACNKVTRKDYVAALERKGYAIAAKEKTDNIIALADSIGLKVLGERSKIQPKPLFERLPVVRTRRARVSVLTGMQDSAYEMQVYRSGLLPITITPERDCSGMCSFYEMCLLKQENGTSGSYEEYRKLQYVETDPYADHHELATEE